MVAYFTRVFSRAYKQYNTLTTGQALPPITIYIVNAARKPFPYLYFEQRSGLGNDEFHNLHTSTHELPYSTFTRSYSLVI
ncbi:MAG: hypothetical protein FWC41_11745 [Firmicutes bacterium]|nr:hypothetical protein [Bacillota bacterium]